MSDPNHQSKTRQQLIDEVEALRRRIAELEAVRPDEREPAENVLWHSEERFGRLVETAPAAILLVDEAGQIVLVNERAEDLFGYPRNELIGQRVEMLLPEGLRVEHRSRRAGFFGRPEVRPMGHRRDLTARRKDGVTFPVEIGLSYAQTAEDTLALAFVIDITERKRIEKVLQENELQYRDLLAAATRQTQEMTLLNRVRDALARELDLKVTLRTIVEVVADTFGYSHVSIYLLDGEGMALQHQVGYEHVIERISITSGVSGRVLRTRQPVLLEDVSTDPDFLGAVAGIESEVCVPLFDQERVVGFLNIESVNGNKLTQADLQLMITLSPLVGIAIGRARLYTHVQQSEARYRAVVEDQSEMICRCLPDGTLTFVNQAYCRFWGKPPDELVGQPFLTFTPAPDSDPVNTELGSLSAAQPSTSHELRFVAADGQPHWHRWTSRAIFDEQGRLSEIQSVGQDITDRRLAEEDAIQRSRTLQALHETASDVGAELNMPALLHRIVERAVTLLNADRGGGVYLYDADKNVLRLTAGLGINEGRAGITILPSEGVAGQVFRGSQPVIVNDYTRWDQHATILVADPPSAVLGVPLFLQEQAVGVLTLMANSQVRTFGEKDVRLAEMFATYAGVAIQNAQLYEQAQREIVERKQAQEKLRSIIEYSTDGIGLIDENGIIIEWNPSNERIVGIAPETALGRFIWDIGLPVTDTQEFRELILEILRTGQVPPVLSRLEYELRRPDGASRTILVALFPIRAAEGYMIGSMVHDITELKQAEAQRIQLVLEQQRVLALHQFIGDASHDLMTPLSIINSSVYLGRKVQDREQLVAQFDKIEEQTTRLQKIIEDMLLMSKLDLATPGPLEYGEVKIYQLLQSLVESYRRTADENNQTLLFEAASRTVQLPVDEGDLSLALSRLVDNALRYTANGGTVQLSTLEDAAQIGISVRDNGSGIADNDLPHIFDHFYRGELHRPTNSGSGLGLSIARRVVELHGGRIEVDSVVGQGSTFRVLFPVAAPTDSLMNAEGDPLQSR